MGLEGRKQQAKARGGSTMGVCFNNEGTTYALFLGKGGDHPKKKK